jgi:hypothetical protein
MIEDMMIYKFVAEHQTLRLQESNSDRAFSSGTSR